MKSFLVYLIAILTFGPLFTPPAVAQTPPPQEMPVLLPDPLIPGRYKTTCPGVGGRIYTFQISTNGTVWTYLDLVKLGVTGTAIEYGFTPISGGRSFFRLKYTVANTYTIGGDGDIDGDGISNQDEVSYFGTDPFVSDDTDGDGYLNTDETAAGTDPNSAASKPFDPNNPPPANRYVVPLAWWLENKFNSTIESITALGQASQLTAYSSKATSIADGSYDLPYLSIQAAVNAANAGDVIQVAPGTYAESVDLSTKNVRLIGHRGGREETIIDPPAGAAQGILLGAGNTSLTMVSGIRVQDSTSGPAIRCAGGAAPVLHNLYLSGNQSGIVADNATPVLANVLCENSTGSAATHAALRITGTAAVKAVGCTFVDNVPGNTGDGQLQVIGAAASLTLTNSIVTNSGAASRVGGQIRLSSGGLATVTYSSIRTGFTGNGNITSQNPADPAAPYFDTDPVSGGQRRLLRTCECVDQGNPAGLSGYTYLTRLDCDGEARRRAYGIAITRPSSTDIGADEFVSRLKFPVKARAVKGQVRAYSEVDEASDVAFLGLLPNGNSRIAITNDEVIDWDGNANGVFDDLTELRKNVITFYDISAADGSLTAASEYSLRHIATESGDGIKEEEIRDPEAIAFDSATGKLYVTTSHTRVNHYRDCEPTTYDPLVDPPSNDYDPRRCVVVTVQLNANLLPIAASPGASSYTDARDGGWTATPAIPDGNRRDLAGFAEGKTNTSAVGYDPGQGLIARLKSELAGNTALAGSVKNNGVLIAINTTPKFGQPVNGVTYQPGAALAYNQTNGLGGPSATAGWVLHLPADQASAAFPYWVINTLPAAGQEIIGYKTAVGGATTALVANNTYYFKAWSYDGAKNYGRGMEAAATLNDAIPVMVNEFFGAGETSTTPDQIEFFNSSGRTITLTGLEVRSLATGYKPIPNYSNGNPVTIGPRGLFRMQRGGGSVVGGTEGFGLAFPSTFNNGGDLMEIIQGLVVLDNYRFTRNQPKTANVAGLNDEGRVWDGGPAGKTFNFDPAKLRFENQGALFRVGAAFHPLSLGGGKYQPRRH
jgi:hypothetical protein